MSEIFISYARSTAAKAQQIADALRGLGYGVWRDDELPAHRDYSEVIEERLRSAKAVVVVWSTEAVKSQWVRAEADIAREAGTLVQVTLDQAPLPMPFNRIQCADLASWTGDDQAPGWRKVVASVADLVGRTQAAAGQSAIVPPTPSKPSIAVLPFSDMTGAGDQDYFVDGMVEEITTALSRIRSIFVIASSSALTFKGKAVGAQDAARQLGVRYVLEGSVRKAGGRVRIAVQLIDSANGVQIWSQRFDETLEDVFALQDKVALAVAGKIEPTVQTAEIRRASAQPTENMGSYDLYLRASPLARSNWSRSGLKEALALLNRAIALDPDYGQALGLAAYGYFLTLGNGWADDPEADTRRGIELALRASAAAGDDALVIAFAAHVLAYLEKDVATAIGMIDRAIAMNPGSATVWAISGALRLAVGDPDLAVEHSETSMRLDPIGPERGVVMMNIGLGRFFQRRFVEALHHFKEVEQQWPSDPSAYFVLALAYGQLGREREASEALARYRTLTTLTPLEFFRRQSPGYPPEFLKLGSESIALAEGQDAGDTPRSL